MTEYEPVIGLEIHVQLSTRTKMFCGCALSFGDPPNVHTCPTCLGLPGALPVANEQAVRYAVLIGLALDCEIAPRSIFHRKNYMYPDLPKGYQISQYDVPICAGGRLGDIRIHRAHLEEDAAKLNHIGESGRIHGSQGSVVDFNRGGTPLVEIVTEPDFHSGEEAREWLQLLRTTLRSLGVSDVNMEEGSLRCDANISVRPVGTSGLGVKTELKNMNSFRFVERGIAAEAARQIALLQDGGVVEQETLHFDPATGSLTPLRSKEDAHDYRYFPEPDLVPVVVGEDLLADARAELPELPAARAERYEAGLGIEPARARLLAHRGELGEFFEAAMRETETPAPAVATWVELLVAKLPDGDPGQGRVTPAALARLAELAEARTVSAGAARTVLERLVEQGGDPAAIVEAEGLGALGGEETLLPVVRAALAANEDAAAKLRDGQMKAIGPIIGYVMRETKGRADGGEVTRLVRAELGV